MNSICTHNPTIKPHFDKNQPTQLEKPTIIQFEHVLEGTDLKIKRELQVPSAIEEDILKFSEDFRTLAQCCDWDENRSFKILRGILSPQLFQIIVGKTTSEDILAELLTKKYPMSDRHLYNKKLLKLRQEDYIYINDYANAITEILKRYSLCYKMSRREVENKYNEIFLYGLDKECLMKFTLEGIHEPADFVSKISKVEEMIIEYSSNHQIKQPRPIEQNKEQKPRIKFCPYHKSTGHDKSECLVLKQRKEEGKSNKTSTFKRSISIIREKETIKYPIINVKLTEEEINAECLLDSGSCKSFINQDFCINNNIKIDNIKGFEVKLADET
ncbi:hypothetical protein H311_04424, partial [Anncaliia algerae PRA109]